MSLANILIVEDDPDIHEGVRILLEGGNLDYQVTIQGRDELADLAKGLDSMRQAFQTQTEHEREITQTNQRMVTERWN